MKPLFVVMEAFGPYSGRQALDFADLRGAGFFLITGPTGAGKTTILDAMSFALYGETSGGSESEGARTGAAMRSDHADPATQTRVRFDFAVGDEIYRVERLPSQERPRLRGCGSVTQDQLATLWRLRQGERGALEIEGAPLASGWTRVTAKTEDILGFRASQFRQVVMLPQGRFQQLITADSGERETILRTLFDTGHYSLIERALADEASAVRQAAKDVHTQRAEVLRQAEATEVEEVVERRGRLLHDAAAAAEHGDAAERADKAAQQALLQGREVALRLAELEAAIAEVAALTIRDAEVLERRVELEAARHAARVADVAREAAAAEAEAADARRAMAAKTSAAATAAEAFAVAEAAHARELDRADERARADAELQRLRGFVAGADALAAARADAASTAHEASARLREAHAAEATWDAAREQLAALDAAWRTAQAGQLARSLRDGAPCPVCGATDHPAPAALPTGAPAEDAVDRARGVADAALQARDAARSSLQTAEAALAAASARELERMAGLPDALAEPTTLAAALEQAEAHARGLADARERALQARHDAHVSSAAAETGLRAAGERALQAEAAARQAGLRLAQRLREEGFLDEAERARAERSPAVVAQLEGLVGDHSQQVLRAGERLRLAREATRGVQPPDLPRLAGTASRSALEARRAREEATMLAAAAAATEKQFQRLGELAEAGTALDARYANVGTLADAASGRNPRHLSFQSYVLGAFLDDVLVAASMRLRLMSKSRYALERTEERSGRKQAAGLGLVVFDAWTGVSRPVTTLSGGEQFMAALSLALGLAEVVQAHAGGIRLDTVFVDEGFGALDDESLDLAVSCLMGLHEGGRLVGIISHVSELRERIDARLEVSAAKSGSSARFVVP